MQLDPARSADTAAWLGKARDLGELGLQCVRLDTALEPLLRQSAPLTEYAWRYRYPGDPVPPQTAEAGGALALAQQVVDQIASRLPAE
jgi:hypothetical protein